MRSAENSRIQRIQTKKKGKKNLKIFEIFVASCFYPVPGLSETEEWNHYVALIMYHSVFELFYVSQQK